MLSIDVHRRRTAFSVSSCARVLHTNSPLNFCMFLAVSVLLCLCVCVRLCNWNWNTKLRAIHQRTNWKLLLPLPPLPLLPKKKKKENVTRDIIMIIYDAVHSSIASNRLLVSALSSLSPFFFSLCSSGDCRIFILPSSLPIFLRRGKCCEPREWEYS